MNILITGGAGFIGSNISQRLWNEGQTITCFDNLSTGSKNTIQHLINQPRFTFIEGDVITLQPEIFKEKFNQIYHLACPASPKQYQADHLRTIQTNTFGTYNVLKVAQKHGARILHASTSEVYGDPLQHPQKENYWGHVNPFGERSCYDEGKRVAESMIFAYEKKGVDCRIARIFNTYGPNMSPDDGRVVSNFIIQATRGQDLTVYGKGEQTRSFCYVDDLVEGLIRLMNHPSYDQPVNLGNPNEFTVSQLAEMVRKIIPTRSRISYQPLPLDDPKKRQPDISLAKKILNWQPQTPLEQGLKKTAEYFQQFTI